MQHPDQHHPLANFKNNTYVLDNTSALPPIPVNDIAPRHSGIVEPAVILLVQRAMNRDCLISPHAGQEVQGPLGAIWRRDVVVLERRPSSQHTEYHTLVNYME